MRKKTAKKLRRVAADLASAPSEYVHTRYRSFFMGKPRIAVTRKWQPGSFESVYRSLKRFYTRNRKDFRPS